MTTSDRSKIGRASSSNARPFKPPRRRIPLIRMVCLGFGAMLVAACWRFVPPTGENARPINDHGLTDSQADSGTFNAQSGPDKPVALVETPLTVPAPLGVPCIDDAECIDGNDCTDDRCTSGSCTNPARSGGCDDSNPCTENDACRNKVCRGTRIICDDDDPCTDDLCRVGVCFYRPNTGEECEDDLDPCTKDVCVNGACTHPDKDCLDEFEFDACTVRIWCVEGVGCRRDWPCDDGDPCTADLCCLDSNGLFSDELCPSDQGQVNCYHDPMWPFFEGSSSCPNVGCQGIIDAPTRVPYNNDDDNGNGISDISDGGPMPEEDDLLPMPLSIPRCPETDSPAWGVVSYGGLSIHAEPDKSGSIYNLDRSLFPVPETLFVQGAAVTTECGAPVVLSYEDNAVPFFSICHWESSPVIVYKVESVDWQAVGGNLPLETCPINGGMQIFPGKLDPLDTAASARRDVKLVATIDPPIGGVTVYFKVWDVDDPFDQNNAGMDNVGIIDGDTSGPDNRPTPEAPQTFTAVTNENGEASVIITVSMQPGNNYRAAATVIDDVFDPPAPDQPQVTQQDADDLSTDGDFAQYQVPVVWSKMLTVWRKLHVELDSMGAGMDPTGVVNRNLDQTGVESGHSNHSWAEINDWSGEVQNGQLEGGTLAVTGGGTYEIVDNLDDAGDDSIFVNGSILLDEDKLATAVDDDAPFVPRKADISLMNQKYKFAYIEIQEHPEQSSLDIPFVVNLNSNDSEAVAQATSPGRHAPFLTSPDFWTVQIVTCFQGPAETDHDPDAVYHAWTGTDFKSGDGILFGATTNFVGAVSYDNVSVVFIETIRDFAEWSAFFGLPPWSLTPVLNAGDLERINAVHEVGHAFGIPGGEDHPPGGLMQADPNDTSLHFTAGVLDVFRNSQYIGEP